MSHLEVLQVKELLDVHMSMVNARLSVLENKVDMARDDVAGLKVKASVWGFLAGLAAPLIGLLMYYVTRQ